MLIAARRRLRWPITVPEVGLRPLSSRPTITPMLMKLMLMATLVPKDPLTFTWKTSLIMKKTTGTTIEVFRLTTAPTTLTTPSLCV